MSSKDPLQIIMCISRTWTYPFWIKAQGSSRPYSISAHWSRAWRTRSETERTLPESAETSTTASKGWTTVRSHFRPLLISMHKLDVFLLSQALFPSSLLFVRLLLDRPKPWLHRRHHQGDVQLHWWRTDLPETHHGIQGLNHGCLQLFISCIQKHRAHRFLTPLKCRRDHLGIWLCREWIRL